MQTEVINIKIVDEMKSFEITVNQSTWSVYETGKGSVMNGHYNYNETDVVTYLDDRRYDFFQDMFAKKVRKIAKKHKFIK